MSRWPRRVAGLVLFVACGCGEARPTAPAGTGARETTEAFYAGLIAHEARAAYDTLDPASRRRFSPEQFAKLADVYARNLGFPAERVHVQACEEQGDTATAHVTLTGRGGGHTRRYADGITLRRTDGRWGVVLPANFAHKTK